MQIRYQSHRWLLRAIAGFAAAALICTSLAHAQSVEEFYRGKIVRIIVGYGEGGAYDLYSRLAAEFLGRHLPGHPTIIVQNMPGAGSLRAAQYLNTIAPKDGLVIGTVADTLALNVAMGDTEIDVTRFRTIGRFVDNSTLGVALPASGIKSFEDARTREIAIGVTGGTASSVLIPLALNLYAKSKFRLVRGYKGSADSLLALERREIDVHATAGLPFFLSTRPTWITKGEAVILFQNSFKRHPMLANVPTVPELASGAKGAGVLRAIASTAEVGRSLFVPPGVPADRIAALRKAFQAMLQDPKFKSVIEQRKIELDAAAGEEVDRVMQEVAKQPRSAFADLVSMLKK